MPDSPSFLARDRWGYVTSHSFVLLIGIAGILSAVGFLYNPDAPQYVAMRSAGATLQYVSYIVLGIGGVLVVAGLLSLSLSVEAAGHVMLCTGIVMTGIELLAEATWDFPWVIGVITLVATVFCILLRLAALVSAKLEARAVGEEIEELRKTARRIR